MRIVSAVFYLSLGLFLLGIGPGWLGWSEVLATGGRSIAGLRQRKSRYTVRRGWAWPGLARRGEVWRGTRLGLARQGEAWWGRARYEVEQ
jgi:hypothetical protein